MKGCPNSIGMKNRIFISYSSVDRKFVSILVRLLRSVFNPLNPSPVFIDIDDIYPGQRWQEEIKHAIKDAEKVFVFWCIHSQQCTEVAREYKYALKLRKILIPILVDNAKLPPPLERFQWVDLRPLNLHGKTRSSLYSPEHKLFIAKSFKLVLEM
jgi:hypothetical protein